jgi:penicillin-binding protein 1A
MWISYMATALKDVPQETREIPSGVTQVDGDWFIPDFSNSGGVRELQ